jgi:hypothetical protein
MMGRDGVSVKKEMDGIEMGMDGHEDMRIMKAVLLDTHTTAT